MITLAIIEFFLDLFNSLLFNLFSNFIAPLNSLSQWISAFAIPQVVLDILSLCCYFLPMTTITVLLLLTTGLISVKIILACVHFLPGIIFGN